MHRTFKVFTPRTPASANYCHSPSSKRIPPFPPKTSIQAAVAPELLDPCNRDCAPKFLSQPGYLASDGRLLLKNLTPAELVQWCLHIGEGETRARHLLQCMYKDGKWIRSFQDLDSHQDGTQTLSRRFKEAAGKLASLSGGLLLRSVNEAVDGTKKLVFDLVPDEGLATGSVETVLIPMKTKRNIPLRYTACVSTQVGCAMNCQFCFTGRMGLMGNLTPAQIVEQVVEARRWLKGSGESAGVKNVVFMGMGEPLHNIAAVSSALDIMCSGNDGLNLGRSKVIVSTVGLVPEMRQLVERGLGRLAVSLHATTDEVRSWIVPTNRKYPLSVLLGALEDMFPLSGRKGDNFVIIEYVLLKDVNDTEQDAHRLLHLLRNIYCMVNLIAFNPHEGTQFQRSTDEVARAFQGILKVGGKMTTLRLSKGDDEMAACGQLGDPSKSSRPAAILRPPVQFRQQQVLEGTEAQAQGSGGGA